MSVVVGCHLDSKLKANVNTIGLAFVSVSHLVSKSDGGGNFDYYLPGNCYIVKRGSGCPQCVPVSPQRETQ